MGAVQIPTAQPVSYGRRIRLLAEERPRDEALRFAAAGRAERAFTWAELERRALQVAALLGARGVGQGSLVALGLRNSPEHVITTLAAWKLGACVLPLRWDLPDWERERLLELARPALVHRLESGRARRRVRSRWPSCARASRGPRPRSRTAWQIRRARSRAAARRAGPS